MVAEPTVDIEPEATSGLTSETPTELNPGLMVNRTTPTGSVTASVAAVDKRHVAKIPQRVAKDWREVFTVEINLRI